MRPEQPRDEYNRRLAIRQDLARTCERREGLLANLRLAVFLMGGALLALVLAGPSLPWISMAIPCVAFVVLIVRHDRTITTLTEKKAAVAHYKKGLARLDGDWPGAGPTGDEFLKQDHPYAADLDLFGKGGLFDLVCTAQTKAGEKILADWFCDPAAPEEILARQEAIDELRENNDLREELAIMGHNVETSVHPDALTAWATDPPVTFSTAIKSFSAVLALAGVVSVPSFLVSLLLSGDLILPPESAFLSLGPIPFSIVILLDAALLMTVRTRVEKVLSSVDEPLRDLDILASVFKRLEDEPFRTPRLRALQSALTNRNFRASKRIRSLRRLVSALDAARNQVFAPFAFILLWRFHFACLIESWRVKNGGGVAQWLDAVGQLESLCALAAYAYERPAQPFPEIVEHGPVFHATGLSHPLVKNCVSNNVFLAGRAGHDADTEEKKYPDALIVSGSNMSGKSTLLRTVGINVVLAQMGLPVCAEKMTLSPFSIGATIRVQDSIQDGASRFYAEIVRLKKILDLTDRSRHVLFLLDEILHGTNSHDRHMGAAAVIKSLLEAEAVGMVTTHDLVITKIQDSFPRRVANVHFIDHLENGKLTFDYLLQPGVVQKSNALDLMRSIGLRV